MLHAAELVGVQKPRSTHVHMANTSLPANSAAQHSFFHVITSSNPIKILFEIQFVFATNSISPPLGLQKEREKKEPFLSDWFHGNQKCENAFFPFVFARSLFTFRYLGFMAD